jgi:exodeoxyribonuclease V
MHELNSLLGFDPNQDQLRALEEIKGFLSGESTDDVFILKGSAGTGKTSIVKAITHQLYKQSTLVRILAPTGRAANVIYNKTGVSTQTIHSAIYYPVTLENGNVQLLRKDNDKRGYTVFIVDESSMVSNQLHFNSDFQVNRPLLDELIDYVKQGNKKNKIIFVGDRFQLPPVKETFSPALCSDYIKSTFNLKCKEIELFEVMRHAEGSEVLQIATDIRDVMMNSSTSTMDVSIDKYQYSSEALKWYLSCYDEDDMDSVTMICAANKNVDTWNKIIRDNLGFKSQFLQLGDKIVTQETWMNKEGQMIFKGSFGRVVSISNTHKEYAGLHFVDAEVCFINNGIETIIDTKIILESIYTIHGKLSHDKEKKLWAEAMKHNPDFRETLNRFVDPYVGAMRVRHSYAITCHKSQGGEWDNVFVHPWKIGNDLPWTYTAITRARNEVITYLPAQ